MNERIETSFTTEFGIQYPIICAPMFLVSNIDMVVAASEAGALGTFPALNYRPVEKYRSALREIKSRTKKPVGVNIIVQSSNRFAQAHLDAALEAGVEFIITSLGHPGEVIRRTRGTKTRVYCDVIGLEHAKKAADLGADGLIAVGSGAGGHAGPISLFALIPYLKKNLQLPIIAAGSIGDGATLLAALALGADGVHMGTRFIASTEAQVLSDYKKAILESGPEDIVNTDRVDGFPGNFIRTPQLERIGIDVPLGEAILRHSKRFNRFLALYRAGRSLLGAENAKASYKTVFSAGHGIGLINEVWPISEIIARTVTEYHAIKRSLP